MPLRRINLPDDLDELQGLLVEAFQYPENPAWSAQSDEIDGLQDAIKTLKRIWPIFSLIKLVSKPMRDALLGYVWEEDGRLVGICMIARRGNTENWMVTSVSVLPDYRRNGIARRLVEACIEMIFQRGGELVALDVISQNLPAFSLYESLGFKRIFSHTAMDLGGVVKFDDGGVHTNLVDEPILPSGFSERPLPESDSETRYKLAKRLVPASVQEFDPVVRSRYHRSPLERLFLRVLNRTKIYDFAIHNDRTGEIAALGFSSAQLRNSGRHAINMNIDPEYPELAGYVIQRCLQLVRSVSPGHVVQAEVFEWLNFTLEAHRAAGFETRAEYNRMAKRL